MTSLLPDYAKEFWVFGNENLFDRGGSLCQITHIARNYLRDRKLTKKTEKRLTSLLSQSLRSSFSSLSSASQDLLLLLLLFYFLYWLILFCFFSLTCKRFRQKTDRLSSEAESVVPVVFEYDVNV